MLTCIHWCSELDHYKIMFSKGGKFGSLREMVTRGVLIFMNVLNLKMTWLVIQSCTKDAIIMCCNCDWKFTHRSTHSPKTCAVLALFAKQEGWFGTFLIRSVTTMSLTIHRCTYIVLIFSFKIVFPRQWSILNEEAAMSCSKRGQCC